MRILRAESLNHKQYWNFAILAIVTLILVGTECKAQELSTPELDGFKKEFNYPVYTPDDLWDYINGGADSYNALGFQELNIVEYKKGRRVNIKLEIYHHLNSDLAFGIYALERAPSYNFVATGVQAYKGEGFYNFLKGEYYVKIYTNSKLQKALTAVDELALLVEQSLEGTGSLPEALKLFPKEGMQLNEEMFIAENVVGHEFLEDAFRATYSIEDKQFEIYIFHNDDPLVISGMAQKYLERQDLDTDQSAEGKSSFKDGYNGNIFLAWKEGMMVIITGLEKEDANLGDNYISKILK